LLGKIESGGTQELRRILVVCLLLAVLALAWFSRREIAARRHASELPAPTVTKLPVTFAQRTFDPANPPSDMPPMNPGETARCDSDFNSDAVLGGKTRRIDDTHGVLTITQITMTLQLGITIWVPADVTPHVIEHEEGHRQISEYYYHSAEKVAEGIAENYMGKPIGIAGADLDAESHKALQQAAADMTAEYNRELNSEPAQLLYDTITDHSRNEVVATEAVSHALKNVAVEATQPANP
jgi:hypothetical protein